jgi:hypothetical protein
MIAYITRACNPGATGEAWCRYDSLDAVARATGTTGYGGGDGPFDDDSPGLTFRLGTRLPYWFRCDHDLRDKNNGPFTETGGALWHHGTKKEKKT